jgi:hypothetical protein
MRVGQASVAERLSQRRIPPSLAFWRLWRSGFRGLARKGRLFRNALCYSSIVATFDLATRIRAPIERCFDLARSVDFHVRTAEHTREHVVAGRERGLLGALSTLGCGNDSHPRLRLCSAQATFGMR